MKKKSSLPRPRRIPAVYLFAAAALLTVVPSADAEASDSAGTVRVISIDFAGMKRTRDFVISREVSLERGRVYTAEEFTRELEKSIRNLKNLGIFSRVIAEASAVGPTEGPIEAAVVFRVTDRWTFFPLPLYYADNKLGHIFGFNIQDFNLFGTGQSLHLKGMYNPDLQSLQLMWHYPRIGASRFRLDLDTGYRYLTEFQFADTLLEYRARTHTFFQDLRLTRGFPVNNTELRLFADSLYTFRDHTEEIDLVDKSLTRGSTWTAGIGLGHGILNYDIGTVWGDDNEILFNLHFPGPSFSVALKHAKYFRTPRGGVLAYRIQSQINPFEEIQLSSLDVRGIKPGQLRGNYGFYLNFDYRPFLFSFRLLVDIDVYGVVFLDAGNMIGEGDPFRIASTVITSGIGTRFYLRQIGGPGKGARLDFGVNITALAEGKPFGYFLFLAFGFDEMF
jgi:outer membrane protein assembly factor BamA